MSDVKVRKKPSVRAHQKVLLAMLKDIDAICTSGDIPYMLFAGSALGAVRHHGFIPWDDDVDILMTRENYTKFLERAETQLDADKYYVQKEYSPHWPMHFSKIRLNHTACMEKYHVRDEAMHQGIYVDIFPCDNLSDRHIVRGLQFLASKVVIAKALYARGYETRNVLKKIFLQGCRLLPRKPFWDFAVRMRDENTELCHTFFACGTKYEKNIFPREWFLETVQMPFEDGSFPVCAHYEEMLTQLYGDYHKIPTPQERRCKEHAAILDLEHSYTQYLEKHRRMRFDIPTRSIR